MTRYELLTQTTIDKAAEFIFQAVELAVDCGKTWTVEEWEEFLRHEARESDRND